MLLGSPAELAVDDSVGGEILDELASDPGQTLRRLHDGDGHVEGLQVFDQGTGIGFLGEPRRQFGCGGGRQLDPQGLGQLDDRLRTQAAIEVVVQRDLGEGAEADPAAGKGDVVVRAHALNLSG